MQPPVQTPAVSAKRLWAGRILSAIAVLFMTFSGVIKFTKDASVSESLNHLGIPVDLVIALGVLELLCTVVYAIPKTSVLGAILLAGYLGGAVVTHWRVGDPLFSHTLFPVYIGVMAWGGLYLRDERLHSLIPVRR